MTNFYANVIYVQRLTVFFSLFLLSAFYNNYVLTISTFSTKGLNDCMILELFLFYVFFCYCVNIALIFFVIAT